MKFDSYHPMINLMYFVTAIICTMRFQHPVYVFISYVCIFLFAVKLGGKRSFIFQISLICLIFVYAAWYSCYHHFGVTVLHVNFIGNPITLESIVTGVVLGVKTATVLMIFSCIFAVVSSDKVIYLFGKISPRLSLYISVLLRFIPRVKQRAKKIETSRKGIGKGCFQGNLWQRFGHVCSFVSILITWTLEDFVESAASMKCRGYSLRGRTAFSIYRFDNRDRGFVVMLFLCMTVTAVAAVFCQTMIQYNPEILMNRVTPLSFGFYVVYAFQLLLPMILQIAGEKRFSGKNCEKP